MTEIKKDRRLKFVVEAFPKPLTMEQDDVMHKLFKFVGGNNVLSNGEKAMLETSIRYLGEKSILQVLGIAEFLRDEKILKISPVKAITSLVMEKMQPKLEAKGETLLKEIISITGDDNILYQSYYRHAIKDLGTPVVGCVVNFALSQKMEGNPINPSDLIKEKIEALLNGETKNLKHIEVETKEMGD
jgi:hypothetical protein